MLDAIPTPDAVLGPIPATVWLILLALAVTRIAGLVALDSIFDRPRLAVGEAANRRAATRWVETLITCMWCVGVWVALAVTVATPGWHGAALFDWAIIGLALAQVAGMLSGIGRG
jgi:hypothetical protein